MEELLRYYYILYYIFINFAECGWICRFILPFHSFLQLKCSKGDKYSVQIQIEKWEIKAGFSGTCNNYKLLCLLWASEVSGHSENISRD